MVLVPRGGVKRRRVFVGARRKRMRLVPRALRGRRADGGELKFFDTVRAAVIPAIAGTVTDASLCLIPQGVLENNRVGRKCTLRLLQLHITITMPSTANVADGADRIRVIIYQDKQTNGATATVLNLLQTATINSFYNLENQMRFRILHDSSHIMNQMVFFAAATPLKRGYFTVSKRLNMPLEFSGVGGALTELRSNNIGVIMLTESTDISAAYTARVRFSDN